MDCRRSRGTTDQCSHLLTVGFSLRDPQKIAGKTVNYFTPPVSADRYIGRMNSKNRVPEDSRGPDRVGGRGLRSRPGTANIVFDVNNRGAERYHVQWKIALVFDKLERQQTFHGRTHDLSLTGTGMLTNVNVFSHTPLVLLLAPPPLYAGQRQKIIEIHARQAFVVYSGATSCFRLGFSFTGFKDDGLQVLNEMLSHHLPKIRCGPSSHA